MADPGSEKNNLPSSGTPEDIIDELESLSKKYGLAFDADKMRKSESKTVSSAYAPKKTNSDAVKSAPPKNNHPARTPRIVYDSSLGSASVRVVYPESAPTGPEGRRVVYKEDETGSIAEKRRRNAAANANDRNNADSRNVASSKPVDSQTFAKTYAERVRKDSDPRIVKKENGVSAVKKDAETSSTNEKSEQNDKKEYKYYKKTPAEKIKGFFKSFIPWKGDSAKEVIRKIVMDISAILIIVCFGYFIDNYIQHKNQLNVITELNSHRDDQNLTDDTDAKWAEIKAKYPDIDFPEGMNIKYAELYAQNQDLVGFIEIPGTSISSPVVKNAGDHDEDTEEDFYLHHDFYKKYNKYGIPYLDAYCTGTTLDKNNTIYGHNMRDGLSFGQLELYYDIEKYKDYPIIKYDTLFESYTFKIYAVFITNGYSSGDNGYLFHYPVSVFSTENNFKEFIEAIDERKLYDTGVDINTDDKLITLSTCSYEIKADSMGRLAVVGRLVRPGESTQVDTSKATLNTNVRYPQIWYDEHNMSNPFKNAYQWIPE